MHKVFFHIFLAIGLTAIFHACSTEKDAALNRFYHQTTTKYNGLYNANELIQDAMRGYLVQRQEDYTEIIPVEPMPDEENALAMFPALDTAISKCVKLIGRRSMPSAEGRSKKEEYNKWMDRVWLKIGEAKYIKGEYQDAIDQFEYVAKFFKNKPSKFTAKIWIVKAYVRQKDYRRAQLMLKELERESEKVIADQLDKDAPKSASKIVRKQNKKSSKGKTEKPLKLPKDYEYELNKAKAALYIDLEKWDEAEKAMAEVVRTCKNRKEVARMNFILAQLAIKNGNNSVGVDSYTTTLKKNAKFDMHFAARLNRAMASSGANREKLLKELNKMLKDSKNAEYKDQIYYALGDMSQTAGDIDGAMHKFTKSVYYSISNERQKGASYERMGDIKFGQKDYVRAQKYYDSCVNVVSETYKNYDMVRTRARRLKDLVVSIETADRNDSLLRIAAMPEDQKMAFLEKVKKQLEEEEKLRKEAEAKRLAEIQALQASSSGPNQGGTGGKWYFYNSKQRDEGFEEFKRIWGQRPLEDNWRRSNKQPEMEQMDEGDELAEGADSLEISSEPVDPFAVETLMSNIPDSDSAVEALQAEMLEAMYTAGRIYQEELMETAMAIEKFEDIIERKIEDKHVLLSSFQLYKLFEGVDDAKHNHHKNYIMNNYPNSDYANFIRDPNYFIKKKEREKLDLEDYELLVQRFSQGMYSIVKIRATNIVENDPTNAYRSGYMLLAAMAQAGLTTQKEDAIPAFERVIESFPGSAVAERAEYMIDVIRNGYSEDILAEFGKKSEFEYNVSSPLIMIVMLDKSDNANTTKTNVSNFSREFFSSDKLKVQLSQFNEEQQFIMIREFPDESKAKKFLSSFMKTKKHIGELKDRMTYLITNENFVKLIGNKNIEGYLQFYRDFY
jgi:tetratricopeptide (TPR) repeat protein